MEAGGRVELGAILGPGATGERVLTESLPPGRRGQVGTPGPVRVATFGASQTELAPARAVQTQNEFTPGSAHQAAAAQVWERQVCQDEAP